MANSIALATPLTDAVIEGLNIGDHVTFSGVIYTARPIPAVHSLGG